MWIRWIRIRNKGYGWGFSGSGGALIKWLSRIRTRNSVRTDPGIIFIKDLKIHKKFSVQIFMFNRYRTLSYQFEQTFSDGNNVQVGSRTGRTTIDCHPGSVLRIHNAVGHHLCSFVKQGCWKP
jgi:hypothetical protein